MMKMTLENPESIEIEQGPAIQPDSDSAAPSFETVLAFLTERPDTASLRAAYPQLTRRALKNYFANASALAARQPIQHDAQLLSPQLGHRGGLSEPDGTQHKGKIFRSLLGQIKPGKMLELGAGKGNYAVSAAELGWQVTAVDEAEAPWAGTGIPDDPASEDHLHSIQWVRADPLQFPISRREYDLICFMGQLHHFPIETQIELITRCAGSLLLLDTRVAPVAIDYIDGYDGVTINLAGKGNEDSEAPAGAETAFRHTEDSLVRLVRECGYPHILMMRPPHGRDYTFYLCLPRSRTSHRAEGGKAKKRATKVRASEEQSYRFSGRAAAAKAESAD
jgi:SAM-dependent methyltransferase